MSQLKTETSVCPFCKSSLPYIPTHLEDLLPGSRLSEGRFIVGRALGHGGYGITYIAYDTKMLVRRTIKEYFPRGAVRDKNLVPVYPESEEANVDRTRKHFLHEARMMIKASEGHIPGIVQGIDTFSENGTSYILMEYLEGYTLDDHMQKVGPFPWKTAVHYVAEALEALQKLHEKNILHRDISCNNIFLCSDNTIRLIDFGSAEPLDQASTDPGSLWRSRKPAYTPREQAENRAQGAYSDIYAMGVVLFKMITGGVDRQLNGKTLPSLRNIVRNDQSIPPALDAILKTATAEEPEKRFQSAAEFRNKLLPLIGEKPKGSKRTGLFIVFASLLAVIALIIILVSGGQEDTWAKVDLDSDSVKDAEIRFGEDYSIQGTSEPGETVKLVLVKDGTGDEIIADETNADSNGNWELHYNTNLADVELNSTAGYVCYVAYQDGNHRSRSGEIRLTVDRTLTPLSIRFAGQESKVLITTPGEKVTVTGSGEEGQAVKVEAGTETWNAEWQDGSWTCEIDTSLLAPGVNDLERDVEITAYYDGMKQRTVTEESLSLSIHKTLRNITVSFEEDENTVTVLDGNETVKVYGTAEPYEKITLLIGSEYTVPVTVKADGSWEAELPPVKELQEYRYNARIEIPVYAYYSIQNENQSEKLTLVSYVGNDEAPIIESSRIVADEGEEISLKGTGEKEAKLTVEMHRGDKAFELEKAISVDEDGNWALVITSSDIPDPLQEGQNAYQLNVYQQKGDKKLTSNVIAISIYKKKTYEIPTILFAESDGDALSLRYSETVELKGTAEAGERMNLLADDEPMTATILTNDDGTWHYSLGIPNGWMPELNGTTEKKLKVKYVTSDESSESLTLIITNKQFSKPGLTLNGGKTELTAGENEEITLELEGEAGERITLYQNGSEWRSVDLDDTGKQTVSMTGSQMTSGVENAAISARYARQPDNQSDSVNIRLDRNAEQIRVEGTLDEESTEIRGTGESGAAITLQINGSEIRTETVDNNNEFTFSGLKLNAGDQVLLTETDQFGNKASWNAQVLETARAAIVPDGYSNGAYITYGPSGRNLVLNGTATPHKTVEINCLDGETITTTYSAMPDDSGKWEAGISLELKDMAQTDLNIHYEDGRGGSVVLHAVCDNQVDPLVIQEDVIYEQTPEILACTVGEANCQIGWVLKRSDGTEKDSAVQQVDGLRANIDLPKYRSAGDILEITVTDAWGNSETTRLTVQEQRNRITGRIASVLCGENDVTSGSTINGSLKIEAYVVAGSEVTGTPSLQMFQNGNVLRKINLSEVSGEELQRTASRFQGSQADLGWKIKGGNLSTEGLEEGACELRLMIGSTVIESWPLKYSNTEDTSGGAMQYYDSGAGYDMGMDVPGSAFRSGSIYLTGWLYDFYDGTALTLKSGLLSLYEDQTCTMPLMSINATNMSRPARAPSTTRCSTEAKSLTGSSIEKAGWVMSFQGKNLAEGTYWAKLDAGGLTFGPFRLVIDANAPQVRLNDYIKNLNWGTEN